MKTLFVLIALCVAVAIASPSGKKVMVDAPGQPKMKKADAPVPNVGGRKKRGTCGVGSKMSSNDMASILADHNAKRKQTSAAADMIKMSWNSDLADRAQEWAEQCTWAHGMSNMCDDTILLGQNLYMTTGSSVDVLEVMDAWFNEFKDYDYGLNLCSEGAICGHYTQLVWSESHEVGCGIAQCPTVDVGGDVWTDAVILACDYWPTGNWDGERPYSSGEKCSQCKEAFSQGSIYAGLSCDEGLCKPCLPSIDSECVCNEDNAATCVANGGAWESGTCSCTCPTGSYGNLCDKSCTCTDTPAYAGTCPGWIGFCTDATYYEFMKTNCQLTCGMCGETPAECL